MAKNVKAASAAKASKAKEAEVEYKYGVANLASDLDVQPASVRVALRHAGVERAGRSYGWNSEREYKTVLNQLKSRPKSTEDTKERMAKLRAARKPKAAKVEEAPAPATKATRRPKRAAKAA
jgi:hypothetical protein